MVQRLRSNLICFGIEFMVMPIYLNNQAFLQIDKISYVPSDDMLPPKFIADLLLTQELPQ